jgi:hypothetical protein
MIKAVAPETPRPQGDGATQAFARLRSPGTVQQAAPVPEPT